MKKRSSDLSAQTIFGCSTRQSQITDRTEYVDNTEDTRHINQTTYLKNTENTENTENMKNIFPKYTEYVNNTQKNDDSENKLFISNVKKTIDLSDKILETDISSSNKKRELVKIKLSINKILFNLNPEVQKIEEIKKYNLDKKMKDNLEKLNGNLEKLNNMFNKLYK